MKIRITGTKAELEVAKQYYQSLENESYVKSVEVSRLYINRGSSTVFRLYIDIEYFDQYIQNLQYLKEWKYND